MMKKQRMWLLVVGLLSLLAAGGGGLYAYRFYDALVTTATAVTVAAPVPPYTVLTETMLTERDVPRGVLDEPIYTSVEQLAGQMTTTQLQPGQLIYRHQVVAPAAFRYTDDPALEVVSFGVDPERAVGGQVQIGHRVNVYKAKKTGGTTAPHAGTVSNSQSSHEPDFGGAGTELLAHAELLARGIAVVDVRARQGEPANRTTAPSQIEQGARPEATKPLQILTVAVDPETARELVELAVDGECEIWVSLSPLTEPETGSGNGE
jgi:Flp pilus assembly protein CpaB